MIKNKQNNSGHFMIRFSVVALFLFTGITMINGQTLITPTANWNTRNTITGRYEVRLVGASAYMPSDKTPYTTCPAPDDRNNDYPNRPYADVDSDPTTFQSSTSTYNETDVCSKIAKAYLYWTGSRRTATPAITDAQAVSCKLKDKNGVYQNITAEYWYKQQYDGSLVDGNMMPYICYADVTNHLSGMTGGEFAVANIYTSTSVSNTNGGQIGAWSIVLVYESLLYTPKTVSFWDNLINSGDGRINPTSVVLSGLDVPATGSIDAFVGMMSLDADAAGNTHTLTIKSNNGGVSTPLNNFFNSSIAMNGVDVTKNINCDNTLGFDAQHRDLANGTIVNGATQVTLTYTTTDRSVFAGVAYVGVQVNEPLIDLRKVTSTDNTPIEGIYTYTVSAENIGEAASDAGAYIYDTLDLLVDYEDGSAIYEEKDELGNTIGIPVGIVATYTPAERKLAFTNIPSLAVGHKFVFTYNVQVKPASEIDLWRTQCEKIIRNKAEIHYNSDKVSYSNQLTCGEATETEVNVIYDYDLFRKEYEVAKNLGAFQVISDKNIKNNVDIALNDYLVQIGSKLSAPADFDYFSDAACTIALNPASLFTQTPTEQYAYAKRKNLPELCPEIFTMKFTIEDCVAPTAQISGDSEICAGESTSLTASGGITYIWSTGSTDAIITESPTSNTTYTVTVTEALGCVDTEQVIVTVNAQPVATADGNKLICAGTDINLTETGGSPSVSWSWSGPNGFASTDQNPVITAATTVASGTYTVTVSSNGCTAASAVAITVNAQPVATAGGNSICADTDINLTETGGSPGVSWSWSGPNSFTSNLQNPVISGATILASGTYNVTVEAIVGGCSATNEIVVTVYPTPDVDARGNSPVCAGEVLNLNELGGDAAGWLWSGPNGFASTDQSPVITPAVGGIYYVSVTDDNNCTASSFVAIIVNAPIAVAKAAKSEICVGDDINLDEIGDSPGITTWSWSGPNGFSETGKNQTIASADILLAASYNYSVTVTDASNCTATDDITIIVYDIPAVVISDQTICEGESALFDAGSGFAVYLWNSGETTQTVSKTAAGTFTVTVTNNGGCTANTSAALTVNSTPVVTVSGLDNLCEGEQIELYTSATADANGYLWSSGETNDTISVTSEGTYTVSVTENSCTGYNSKTVSVYDPEPTLLPRDVCEGNTVILVPVNSSIGNFVKFAWTDVYDTNTVNDTNSIYSVSEFGNHDIKVIVTDEYGCVDSVSAKVTVYPTPHIDSVITYPKTKSLEVFVTGRESAKYTYSIPGKEQYMNNKFIDLEPGEYKVFVVDENNCADSVMTLLKDIVIIIPNWFTPDGDGYNDTWEIRGIDAYPDADIWIFNRFGKFITHYKGIDQGWNGVYVGMPEHSDDYWYIVDIHRNRYPYTGHFSLIR